MDAVNSEPFIGRMSSTGEKTEGVPRFVSSWAAGCSRNGHISTEWSFRRCCFPEDQVLQRARLNRAMRRVCSATAGARTEQIDAGNVNEHAAQKQHDLEPGEN